MNIHENFIFGISYFSEFYIMASENEFLVYIEGSFFFQQMD